MAKMTGLNHSHSLLRAGGYAIVITLAMSASLGYTGLFQSADVESGGSQPDAPGTAGQIVLPQPPQLVPVTATWLLDKPLFLESRTKPLPQVVAVAPPVTIVEEVPPPVPKYVVGGIITAPAARRALLRKANEKSGQWWNEGETTAEGWMVLSIGEDAVVLSNRGRKIAFHLYSERPKSQSE
jgi:hypothetical protein